VVSWGLWRGPLAALGWGLAVGAMLDAVSPAPFGYYTVSMLAVAGVVAVGHGRLHPGNLLLPGLVVVVATLAFLSAQLAPSVLAGRLVVWQGANLMALAAKSMLLALVWLPVVYFPLRALTRRGEQPRIDWER
jgi:rod shape-determining protein MreD